ncbi:MAG: ATP-binding cassette domain-containing protein [Chloroflexota bacterium]|nr:ATP-binding cassette domain-containing protein [Chloroflexota bacterium]
MITAPPVPAGTVEVTGLSYSYPPTHTGGEPVAALNDISFRAEPGQIAGITGTSGAGKSTLCLALNGIVPRRTGGAFRGRVAIGGRDTRQYEIAVMATRVAMVFQQPESNLVGLSVAADVAFGPENLGVSPSEIAARVTWALDRVGMADYRDAAPARLSGGQQQRVAIAAALAMQPAVLVLDEPTAALDPLGAEEVLGVLGSLAASRETTIILASQDADALAGHADWLIVLDGGQVIASGTPPDVYAGNTLIQLQSRGIAVSAMAELSATLNARVNQSFAFQTVEDAHRDLAAALSQA